MTDQLEQSKGVLWGSQERGFVHVSEAQADWLNENARTLSSGEQYADAWVSGYEEATKAFVEQLRAAGEEKAALDTWGHFHDKSRAEWRGEAVAFLARETSKQGGWPAAQ